MSAIQKLNAEIHDVESAGQAAQEAAHQARQAYDDAIEAGDTKAADQALQDQATQERQAQIFKDLAVALERRRHDAERVDLTPAALSAIEAAQRAVDAEQAPIADLNAAIEKVGSAINLLVERFAQTDEALSAAGHAIRAAHLREHPAVPRPGFTATGDRLHGLARRLAFVKQAEIGIHEGVQGVAAQLAEMERQRAERNANRQQSSEPASEAGSDSTNWAYQA